MDIIKVSLQKQLHYGKNNNNVVFAHLEYNMFSPIYMAEEMFIVEFFRKFFSPESCYYSQVPNKRVYLINYNCNVELLALTRAKSSTLQ